MSNSSGSLGFLKQIQQVVSVTKNTKKKEQLEDELVAAKSYITSGFQLQEKENDGDDYYADLGD